MSRKRSEDAGKMTGPAGGVCLQVSSSNKSALGSPWSVLAPRTHLDIVEQLTRPGGALMKTECVGISSNHLVLWGLFWGSTGSDCIIDPFDIIGSGSWQFL